MHIFVYNRVTNEGLKPCHSVDKKPTRASSSARAGKRRKMHDVGIVRCTCTRAWDRYVPRGPHGTEESHIHGIYGGIALLEHLRTTMTMHRDALLRARRAIRVMHQDAPGDFLSLFLFLSQFLRIVTQRRPRFCACGTALIARGDRFYVQISIARHTRRSVKYCEFKLKARKICPIARDNRYYDVNAETLHYLYLSKFFLPSD